MDFPYGKSRPPPVRRARARRLKVSDAGGGEHMRARHPPLETFKRSRKVKGWGRGSEAREEEGQCKGKRGKRGKDRRETGEQLYHQKYDSWACR